MTRKCDDCIFSCLQDHGYSNWTVEGTDFTCLKKKHSNGTFDRWYGGDDRLNYANECESFERGDGVYLDVDGEDWPSKGSLRSDIEILFNKEFGESYFSK